MGIKNGNDMHLLKNIAVFGVVIILTLAQTARADAVVETGIEQGPTTCSTGQRLIDFENGNVAAGSVIGATIAGLSFSDQVPGQWLYGDESQFGAGSTVYNGEKFAFLYPSLPAGTNVSPRINFGPGMTASFFSLLISTPNDISPSVELSLQAFDASDNLLGSAVTGKPNWPTFTKLTVNYPNIAYVRVNGPINQFLIDDICTDAPATAPSTSIPEFPTILVPIISAIGLMLLFQRRTYR